LSTVVVIFSIGKVEKIGFRRFFKFYL